MSNPKPSIADSIRKIEIEERIVALSSSRPNLYISLPEATTVVAGDLLGRSVKEEPWMRSQETPAQTRVEVVHVWLDGGQQFKVANLDCWQITNTRVRKDLPVYPGSITIGYESYTFDQLKAMAMPEAPVAKEVVEPPAAQPLVDLVTTTMPEAAESGVSQADELVAESESDMLISTPPNESDPPAEMPGRPDGSQPFHRWGQVLTDGVVSIPINRPVKKEWKTYQRLGLSHITEVEWPQFIRKLEGCFWEDVKDDLRGVLTNRHIGKPVQTPISNQAMPDVLESVQEFQEPMKDPDELVLTLDQAIERIAQQEDFAIPADGEVVFGNRAIRRLDYQNDLRFFIVEGPVGEDGNPRYGVGINIFTDEEVAIAFAQGLLPAVIAKTRTILGRRINHRGDYVSRMDKAMRGYARRLGR